MFESTRIIGTAVYEGALVRMFLATKQLTFNGQRSLDYYEVVIKTL